ncbi:MAG TPA: NAD(P)-dependent oxidoreductase [Bacteroidetes bacterium]|nr:NAD(P)-dependent oxidoreductase [Bacteroidota bacterium]
MRIGFIGIGLMGRPMAHRLLQAKHEVYAYNRTRSKAEWLADKGAKVCDTPADAVQPAEVVILMLADAAAIRDVLQQIPAELRKDRIFVQMGTISPQESREFQAEIEANGGHYLEAPVLGSIPEAQAGKLFIFAAGDLDQYHKVLDVLQEMGEQVHYLGEVGKAAALKLALNQLIASHITAFSLSLGMVRRAGVDVDLFMNILRGSALYAPTFDKKLPRLLERNYANPTFPARLMLKDVRLVLRQTESTGLRPDHVRGIEELLRRAIELGHGDEDYSSVYDAVDEPGGRGGTA